MQLSVPCFIRASLVGQMVKNLPALRETWVQSLGWEDPLEEGMTAHSNLLAYYCPLGLSPWSEVAGRLESIGSQRVWHDWVAKHWVIVGLSRWRKWPRICLPMKEMQEVGFRSFCQEDPLEKGMASHSSTCALRIPWAEEPGGATVHGVAKSQTWLNMHTKLI